MLPALLALAAYVFAPTAGGEGERIRGVTIITARRLDWQLRGDGIELGVVGLPRGLETQYIGVTGKSGAGKSNLIRGLKLQFCAAAKPGKPAKTGASKPVRACRRHYGVQTEIASLFAIFGIFSRHTAQSRRDRRAGKSGAVQLRQRHSARQRKIRGGGKRQRRVLYSATVAAVRCNPALRPFYHRLRATGKPTKVALVAAMRRLLFILNAMLKTKTSGGRHVPPLRHAAPTGLPTSPQAGFC
jgi:hypothetical protein